MKCFVCLSRFRVQRYYTMVTPFSRFCQGIFVKLTLNNTSFCPKRLAFMDFLGKNNLTQRLLPFPIRLPEKQFFSVYTKKASLRPAQIRKRMRRDARPFSKERENSPHSILCTSTGNMREIRRDEKISTPFTACLYFPVILCYNIKKDYRKVCPVSQKINTRKDYRSPKWKNRRNPAWVW